MRKTGIVLAVGVLVLSAAGVQAEEKVVPVPAAEPAPGNGCSACGGKKKCHAHGGRLLDWLCYRPSRSGLCSCFQCPPCIRPPLYAYFLDRYSCANGSGGPVCAAAPAPAPGVNPQPMQKAVNNVKEEIIILTVDEVPVGEVPKPLPVEGKEAIKGESSRPRPLPLGTLGRGESR
jgi:hypothetical protein